MTLLQTLFLLLLLGGSALTNYYGDEDEDEEYYQTFYALEGTGINLTSAVRTGPYFWAKGRSWSLKSDQITAPNNCSFRKQYHSRILSCNQTLTLINLTWADTAIYRVRGRLSKEVSEYQYLSLKVFSSLPILSLVTDEPHRVLVRCDDLNNSQAEVSIEKVNRHHQSKGTFTKLAPNIAAIGPQSSPHDLVYDLRCCSTYKNIKTCGPWKRVCYALSLSRSSVQHLPHCSNRNGSQVSLLSASREGIPVFTGNLLKSQCHRSMAPVQDSIDVCEGQNTTLINSNFSSWFKLREFGGRHRVFKGMMWSFVPQRNFTGSYMLFPRNFTMTVLPSLQVAVEIMEIQYARWVLRCAHNGRPEAKVTWTVGGQYGEYQVQANNTLIVYPDCWVQYSLVASQLGLRCSVTDGPWHGHSLWVHGLHEQKLVPYSGHTANNRHPAMGTSAHNKDIWKGEEPPAKTFPETGY